MLSREHQFLLPQLTALHSRTLAAFSRKVGMHISRFRVLYLLHVMGESSPTALRHDALMDAAALTRVMQDFEAEGLIVRRTDPGDARSRLAALTPAGSAKVVRLLEDRDRFVQEALEGLGPHEMDALAALMRRVESNVSALAGMIPIGDSLNIDPRRAGKVFDSSNKPGAPDACDDAT